MINGIIKYCLGTCLLSAIFFCSSCKNNPEEVKALTGGRGRQEDRATDVTLIYSKEGNIKMRAFARDFVRNEAANPAYIDMNGKLKAEFFDTTGKVDHILTADSCRYYTTKGDVIVWDSVKIVSSKGEVLQTPELIWSAGIQKFFTEKPVSITTPEEVLYGNGMEANSDFSWYQVNNPHGSVEVKKGELPQ